MRRLLLGAAVAVAAGLALVPSTANAWWHGGFYGPRFVFFGPPVIYAPPPVVYAPPPVVYAPAPPPAYVPAGQTCYAGAYVCPLERATPVGAGCSCPTNTGRAYGTTH